MVKFPSELDGVEPTLLYHKLIDGFTVEVAMKFVPLADGYVVMGEVTQKGFIVVGCAAYNPEKPIYSLGAINMDSLRILSLGETKRIGAALFYDMAMRIKMTGPEMRKDAMIARTIQMHPAANEVFEAARWN